MNVQSLVACNTFILRICKALLRVTSHPGHFFLFCSSFDDANVSDIGWASYERPTAGMPVYTHIFLTQTQLLTTCLPVLLYWIHDSGLRKLIKLSLLLWIKTQLTFVLHLFRTAYNRSEQNQVSILAVKSFKLFFYLPQTENEKAKYERI